MPVVCPSCGRSIAIKDPKPGRFRIACPECARPFGLRVGDGPDHEMSARPIATDPKPAEPTADAQADFVASLPGVLGGVRQRIKRLLRAATHPQSRVGDALILEELGRTSSGTIARGRRLLVGRDVVVRLLPVDWGGGNPIGLARATREAYVGTRIVHPNLVAVEALGTSRGRRYVLEEALTGPTFADLARRPEGVAPEAAIAFVLQAARGLLAAHEQGLAHGDPSPEHLRLDGDGVVKLAGLGLGATIPEAASEPFAKAAERDVRILGLTLQTLVCTRSSDVRNIAYALGERMKAAGTLEGVRDLPEAVRSLEDALRPPAGQGAETGEADAIRLQNLVQADHDVPLASVRSRLLLGTEILLGLFAILAAWGGRWPLVGGILGLGLLSATFYGLLRSGMGRSALLGRARDVLLCGSRADGITMIAAMLVVILLLYALGRLWTVIGLAIVSAGFATAFYVAFDVPIGRDREAVLAEVRALRTSLRKRGVSEIALRDFVRSHGGERWAELFERLFGLDATRTARRTATAGWNRDAVRFAVLDRLDARLVDRRESRARAWFEPLEAAALVAKKVNEMTARRKSKRIAEALILIGREVEAASRASNAPRDSASTLFVTPRPIPDLIRDAVETPDRLLTTTGADETDADRGPHFLVTILAGLVGPRVRFLLGAGLLAAFVVWADQVGAVSTRAFKDLAEQAIDAQDVGVFKDVKVDLKRVQTADAPLVIPGIPIELSRHVMGYGVGAAGLILLVSSFVSGSFIALFAIPAAIVAWFAPRFGLPAVGPFSAPGFAATIGGGLLLIGLFVDRRR